MYCQINKLDYMLTHKQWLYKITLGMPSKKKTVFKDIVPIRPDTPPP